MPMDPVTLTPVMSGALISNGIVGSSSIRMASGLAIGLSEYSLSGITVQSIDVGTLGEGVGTGIGVLVTPTIVESMIASFISYGITGIFGVPLATAIATGFIESFALALVETISTGVGVGAGEAFMIPNPAISLASFLSGFSSAGLVGISIPQLASAVASGLDQVLPTSTSILAIVGPPNISPSGGSGLGKIL